MKVIFLDFDGVLNNTGYCRSTGGAENDSVRRPAVHHLNNIIRETDAKIVFSTDWREPRTIPELKNVLVGSGFTWPDSCIGVTEVNDRKRVDQISDWLLAWHIVYGITKYIILDDIVPEEFKELRSRHVYCRPMYGLNKSRAEKAIKLLNEEL